MADMQARLGRCAWVRMPAAADRRRVETSHKEDIIPDEADKAIFWVAPLISVTAECWRCRAGNWAVVPDCRSEYRAFVYRGISALEFSESAGRMSSNSHYSLLGALRSAAQLVSYETAAGMAIVGALLLAGTLSTREIVATQNDYGVWFVFAAPVGIFIYVVASIAETNRAPFDLPEAESELVAAT